MKDGYFRVAQVRGVAIRVHWLAPLVAIAASLALGSYFAWIPVLLVILLHEVGHALFARAFRLKVLGIDVHAAGGACIHDGSATEAERCVIAWGGVSAQALLALVLVVAWPLVHRLSAPAVASAAENLFNINLLAILLNLLPVRPLDGWQAWQLFRFKHVRSLLHKSARRAELRDRQRRIEQEFARLPRERSKPQHDEWLN